MSTTHGPGPFIAASTPPPEQNLTITQGITDVLSVKLSARSSSSDSKLPDLVNHPPHYTKHPSGAECIQITEHMNFNIGNAMKYLWRADHKNGIEDLRKAAWYVQREIERLTKYPRG